MSHEFGHSKLIWCHLPLLPVKQTLAPWLIYHVIKWLLQIGPLPVHVVHNDRFPRLQRLLNVTHRTSNILLWEEVLFVWDRLWRCKRYTSN